MTAKAEQKELLDELRTVLDDTESLIKATVSEQGDKAGALGERIAANLYEAKAKLIEAERLVAGKAKAAAKATDDYVHENPWTSIGIAAGVGFLLGMLVSRR
ncbi:Membrane-anchored ribosome-binding protein, inhibits growth in stationary phase, ElaB/YqjD/DUF883 family [Andreprevotia lacus DSM 23236]|jgi:ElaB/YqjD/DUF883 family membrane-anchored ribosome-binding protein|uniref:Membrane-anchored ribosome-binding protein, inhibits growth in stationary phase, ElaB/YqjD/DUF883 family n=1 Tax=Andreprevotia lacus DSM 23236 TaxID=1121001 RepID=A0A1W1XXK2_9NEIS|nr:DUF883 family protein [Andreprevotia lacus]SMC28574.1 Membrane-anchored ribosome-binding protein, inhibits growth in stationary phase, ElaB/YqjD/DUF883 family [Andreprevotia lacus DSM 23236]